MAAVVLLLCLFNIIMWLVLILRFRNIFSTDGIMQETREQLNAMLIDINRNAERNISLIDDRIRELKEVTEEADRHIQLLKGEISIAEKNSAFQAKYERIVRPEIRPEPVQEEPQEEKKKVTPAKPKKPRGRVRPPAETYMQEQKQGDLFVSEPENTGRISLVVEPLENQAVTEPVDDGPVITKASEPLAIKKSFNREVQELAAQGMKADEIAAKLGRTVPEVNFVLEIS